MTHEQLADLCLASYSPDGPAGFTRLGGDPGPKAFARLEPDGTVTLVLTGTDDVLDVIADAAAVLVPWRGMMVHAGFLAWWKALETAVLAFVGMRMVRITGHSAGGDMAYFAGLSLLGQVMQLVTFGAANPGDAGFRKAFSRLWPVTTCYVYALDLTPRVPPLAWGYAEVCPATYLDADLRARLGAMARAAWRTVKALVDVRTWGDFRRALLKSALADELGGNHHMETYRDAVRAQSDL